MNKPRLIWVKMGVTPGAAAGGVIHEQEFLKAHGDEFEVCYHTHRAIFDWFRETGMDIEPYDLLETRGAFCSAPLLCKIMLGALVRRYPAQDTSLVIARNQFCYDLIPAIRISRKVGAPLITYIHGDLFPRFESRSPLRFMFVLFDRIVGFLLSAIFSKHIFMVNPHYARAYRRIGFPAKNLHVIPNGVDFELIRSIAKSEATVEPTYDLVYFGRLSKSKGTVDLLRAMRRLKQRRPAISLLLFGMADESFRKEMERLIAAYDLAANIELRPAEFDPDKKYRLLNRARVFVFPTYVDTWGISLVEMMALGKACVVYDIVEMTTLYRDKVLFARRGSNADLAAKIETLLADEDQRHHYEQQSLACAEQLSWRHALKLERDTMMRLSGNDRNQE